MKSEVIDNNGSWATTLLFVCPDNISNLDLINFIDNFKTLFLTWTSKFVLNKANIWLDLLTIFNNWSHFQFRLKEFWR